MALTLDLQKSAQSLMLSLEKQGISQPPRIDLAFNLDVSGSFDDEHRAGVTSTLLSRLVPWAMVFDPDQKIEVFSFSHHASGAHYVGDVTPKNHGDYVRRQIIDKVPGYNGGTDYSYVIEKNLQHFGWAPAQAESALGSLVGRMGTWFGRQPEAKPEVPAVSPRPTIIIHVTDGENTDHRRTIEVLRASQNRNDKVYFLFLGVSQQTTPFAFIASLGEQFPNVGFVAVNPVRSWVQQKDEAINQALLTPELIQWLKV